MDTKKKIIYAITSLIAIIGVIWLIVGTQKSHFVLLNKSDEKAINSKLDILNSKIKATSDASFPVLPKNNREIIATQNISSKVSTESKDQNKIEITFKVGEKIYQVSLPKDSTVYSAMKSLSLSSTTPFEFKAKEYPGIGYFIEEINNVKNNEGKYWTLYVNDKYAPVGASDYKLMKNDKVEWKYE